MISVYPAFYKDFRCKADRCVHSCCMQNWDIDIDEATAMKYLVMTGEPGETIRASMTGTKGNRRFIMKDGRCPLLQEDGLCRIIAETGEENLCDICAMHPRFFVENGNFELAGVGLACEESVELLLSNSKPLLFMEDSGFSLFDFPTLLSAMGYSLPEKALSYTPTINETYCRTILHALSQTEPVDEAWTKRLSSLSGSFTSTLKKASSYLAKSPLPELTAVYQYIFYRALEKEQSRPNRQQAERDALILSQTPGEEGCPPGAHPKPEQYLPYAVRQDGLDPKQERKGLQQVAGRMQNRQRQFLPINAPGQEQ